MRIVRHLRRSLVIPERLHPKNWMNLKRNSNYSSDAVIGKTGMEQYMELQLQGTDGEES